MQAPHEDDSILYQVKVRGKFTKPAGLEAITLEYQAAVTFERETIDRAPTTICVVGTPLAICVRPFAFRYSVNATGILCSLWLFSQF